MERNRGMGWLGLIGGIIAGLILGGVLGVVVGYVFIVGEKEEAVRGWTLVYAITASEDIPECTTIEMEMLQQQPIPEQFVTESVVRPDSVHYIIGQTVSAPVKAGDLILWALVGVPLSCDEEPSPPQDIDDEAPADAPEALNEQ